MASKSIGELEHLKSQALKSIEVYLDGLIANPEQRQKDKAGKLSYWLEDYVRLLRKEETYNPKKHLSYERGDVIKLPFGYNIGSEQGGLHYAVVISNSPQSSPILTVIPLSSKKEGKPLHYSSVDLGNDLFKTLMSKRDTTYNTMVTRFEELKTENEILGDQLSEEDNEKIGHLIEAFKREIICLQKVKSEIMRMKQGSIALVSQITTISKVRIYNPLDKNDVLYKIKLSPQSMDMINEKIQELFVYKKS